MKLTVAEIARLVDGVVKGDPETIIAGVAGLEEATPNDITFLANPKYSSLLSTTKAGAVIVKGGSNIAGKTTIEVKKPALAFTRVLELAAQDKRLLPEHGIHPTAAVSPKARLGSNVSIGAFTVIEDGAQVGNNTVLYPQCYVGYDAKLGHECLIYPQVVIREKVVIGNRCIIHSGTVIGADGFGFIVDGNCHRKIPQLGTVIIGDDVEAGANVTIDRATTGATIVGSGTKIDNLVQVAHNVRIGANSIIVAQAGIAGSVQIGEWVTIGGQAAIIGHLEIGDKAIVAGRSGVTKNVPANMVVSGYPARPHREELKIEALIRKLPELLKERKK